MHVIETGTWRRCMAAVMLCVALPATLVAQRATSTLRGTVTDAAGGQPLAGAQVFIPSSRQGAVTDERGQYAIASVAAGPITVRVRMIGYELAERTLTIADGQDASADFTLRRTALVLDATVVTATGAERTKQIGTAIATIDTAALGRTPMTDPQQILAGRAAGVTVMANSGQPGAGGTIRLRGINSVSQGNNPIIIVDGVRIFNGRTPTTVGGRQSTLPLNDIDPADIERMEIVKGPAATTLYGTEASGGVIQIFTKQGTASKPVWSAQVATGFNNMGHVGPKDDPTGLFLNECRGPNLVAGDGTRFEDPTCPASGSWLRNGPVQRYSLSVRGGSTSMNYYASGNYASEDGVIRTGGNTNGGFRGNFSFRPTTTLEFAFSSGYTKRDVRWVADGNNGNGLLLNVSRGPYSNFLGAGCSDPAVVCVNNGAILTSESNTTSDHYVTGVTVTYTPIEKLTNRFSVGYDDNNALATTVNPFGFPRVPLGNIDWRTWNRKLITMDYAGTLRLSLGASLASTSSWGGQLFDSRRTQSDITASNFSGPGKPTLISASQRSVDDDINERVVNAGFFLQEMVAWRDRLFVTGGMRMDGNSAFGSGFGLQLYPKVSASYVISEEDFWPRQILETVKLRGAMGESGKAPGAFDAVRTWDPVAGENGQPAVTPSQLGNPNLGPERTREIEVGVDASALAGRIGVAFTYYRQHTFDALIGVRHSPSEGFSGAQLENVGELRNRGIELTLDADLLRRPDFTWHARLNLTKVKGSAVDLGGQSLTISSVMRTYVKEGYPVPSYWGKRVVNANEFADPVIDSSAYLGSAYPTDIISPSTSITFLKRFTLDVLGEFQRGGSLMNAVGYQNAIKGVWQPCYATQAKLRDAANGNAAALNDVTALERARCSLDATVRDYDYWIERSDFFKLRSVSLTYALPERLIPGVRAASITLSGQNLFTSTKYSGTDPEVTDTRDSSFGRRDYYNFPGFRTFLASARVTF
jgi:outer membrane receptor for ferrienterochelin and colicin